MVGVPEFRRAENPTFSTESADCCPIPYDCLSRIIASVIAFALLSRVSIATTVSARGLQVAYLHPAMRQQLENLTRTVRRLACKNILSRLRCARGQAQGAELVLLAFVVSLSKLAAITMETARARRWRDVSRHPLMRLAQMISRRGASRRYSPHRNVYPSAIPPKLYL